MFFRIGIPLPDSVRRRDELVEALGPRLVVSAVLLLIFIHIDVDSHALEW